MKNPFDGERADEEFVAATKNAEIRKKQIAKSGRVRNLATCNLLVELFLALVTSAIVSEVNAFMTFGTRLWACVLLSAILLSLRSLSMLFQLEVQIKVLKAARD